VPRVPPSESMIMPSVTHHSLSLEHLQQLVTQPELIPSQVMSVLASLASDDEEVRAYANDCLEQIEQPAEAWLPQLAPRCNDPCAPVANWACKLTGLIGSAACQHPLVTALRTHASIGVRQQAALSLSKTPDLQSDAIEAISAAASDNDPRLQRIAQQLLNGLS